MTEDHDLALESMKAHWIAVRDRADLALALIRKLKAMTPVDLNQGLSSPLLASETRVESLVEVRDRSVPEVGLPAEAQE